MHQRDRDRRIPGGLESPADQLKELVIGYVARLKSGREVVLYWHAP